MYVPLPFYEQVQHDVDRDNSLVVFGRGLGMYQALANFVSRNVRPGKLIIGIHVSRLFAVEVLWPAIVESVSAGRQKNPALLLPRFLNSDYSVKDRKEVYQVGGFVVVTANVLVHDFLHQSIPTHLIDGLVVFAAEGVRESSNEHFAVKLFRMRNKTGFIKAFSENPHALAKGFHNCEKVMRMLFLSRLCLWPRFHKAVKNSLRAHVPDLVDLSVDLSEKMIALMKALREIAKVILDELRVSTKMIDVSDVYREVPGRGTMLVPWFDELVRRQVECAEEKISWKVKGLVADLASLRGLLYDVLELNAVQFYQQIVTLRHTSPKGSNWLLRKESQKALFVARSRVWVKVPLNGRASKSPTPELIVDEPEHVEKLDKAEDIKEIIAEQAVEKTRGRVAVVPKLEPCPKWQAVISVLNEVQEDARAAGPDADVGRVIIFVKEKRLVQELQAVLTIGSDTYMQRQFKSVFPTISAQAEADAKLLANPGQYSFKQLTMTQFVGKGDSTNGESAKAKRLPVPSSFSKVPRKRPRIQNVLRAAGIDLAGSNGGIGSADEESFTKIVGDGDSSLETLVWCAEYIDIQGRARRIMEEFRPSFVVLYDADVSLVRQTELYKASHHGCPVRLYILAYGDILEEEKFSNGVAREKEGFKGLIRERATMAIHEDQEGRREEDLFMSQALDGSLRPPSGSSNIDSRLETVTRSSPGKIIVDTRELRSALPMLLHKANVNIVPLTIEVGDFILSNRIGVERKSVPDLHGSFASGRLFNQAEALCQHYKYPCLLIELDADKPLSLSATGGGIPSELMATSIISKMVLLLQQFPSLRLFWARGAQDAVDIFLAVKHKEGEPDETLAASLGVDSAKAVETEYNAGPKALLRSLPGIDGKNISSVMRKVRNVATLIQMTRTEMDDVLGSPEKAKMLYDFVHEEPTEALAALCK